MNLSLVKVKEHVLYYDSCVKVKHVKYAKTAFGFTAHVAFFAAFFTQRYSSMQRCTRVCSFIYSLMAFNPLLQGVLLYKREIPALKSAPSKWQGQKQIAHMNEAKSGPITPEISPRKLSVIVTGCFAAYEFCALASAFLTYAPFIKRLSASARIAEIFQQQLRLCGYIMAVVGTADMLNQAAINHKVPENKKLILQGHYITKSLLRLGFFADHAEWLEPANELLHHTIHGLEIRAKVCK